MIAFRRAGHIETKFVPLFCYLSAMFHCRDDCYNSLNSIGEITHTLSEKKMRSFNMNIVNMESVNIGIDFQMPGVSITSYILALIIAVNCPTFSRASITEI